MTDRVYKLGDLVTRDGSDIHEIIEEDEGYGAIIVKCVKAPSSGWCKVGDVEMNMAGRYAPVNKSTG
jgi:hypothetical protein